MTITTSRTYMILASTALEEDTGVTLIGLGSPGASSSKRILTYPTSDIIPFTYWSNPARTLNFDKEPMIHPITSATLTMDDTKVTRFGRTITDVIIKEVWTAERGNPSMPAFFARQLYEYLINPPEFNPLAPVYITWEPLDRAVDGVGKKYNIEILSMMIGGTSVDEAFDWNEIYDRGGVNDGGGIYNAFDDLDLQVTGVIDRTVEFRFKLVSEVT